MNTKEKQLPAEKQHELLTTLKTRFTKNMNRHKDLDWPSVEAGLQANDGKLWSLYEMERTGGEPDVVFTDASSGQLTFFDCSPETPKGRRNICYDRAALDARKTFKPENTAIDMAMAMGIELLTEEQYRALQQFASFDLKTSSWIKTPPEIRKLGGALFADRRYDHVFIYHNGASSYYSARGFRGSLII